MRMERPFFGGGETYHLLAVGIEGTGPSFCPRLQDGSIGIRAMLSQAIGAPAFSAA